MTGWVMGCRQEVCPQGPHYDWVEDWGRTGGGMGVQGKVLNNFVIEMKQKILTTKAA